MQVLFYAITFLIVCDVTYGFLSNDQLQCRDENNVPVDWYVLYKLPKIHTSSNPLIRKGLAYLYITNLTIGTGWRLSTRPIAWNNSIPGITLAPLYDRGNEDENLWNLYNDSPPSSGEVSQNYGHTKGVVMANRDRGFWLIHSVPNFPPVPKAGLHTRPGKKENITITGKYDYPESGTYYGQSFLCISLGSDQFDIVGKQLMYNEVAVYGKNIPETLGNQYPTLTNATNQKHIKNPPYNHKAIIKSLGSFEFTSFAKDGKWGKELYADFVAPQLQSNLDVQSWLNGRGKLPSTCSRRRIYNVKTLKFEAANADYTSTRDHSKWAITINKKSDDRWVCIGDINRADTQFSRGGGAVCFNQPQLWVNYRDVVNDVEPCS
ncbi:Plancitoxin-1 [Habropoda laboriosa]|uniref:Plancitoxin-1 n=1 Tax=Habropoda laboriosa TaxID=597456 RepID=A0A0L7R5D3_9HYME|nr:PREDICTED: plancitoxin-1 [Habropoda laboriosa]KOC65971.1 Plancitoxin-1 [Habropoda laboriosa]